MSVSLKEFFKMLNNHDYTYQYSDDHRYYQAGSEEAAAIKQVLEAGIDGDDYELMYEDFIKFWYYGGEQPEWYFDLTLDQN